MANLTIPIRSYLEDLETNWNPNNTGSEMPQFKEATEDNTPMYFNLTNGDAIIGFFELWHLSTRVVWVGSIYQYK